VTEKAVVDLQRGRGRWSREGYDTNSLLVAYLLSTHARCRDYEWQVTNAIKWLD